MTPGARAAAAIAVLDQILAGQPAEQALTNWGRASRFAGSGDRAAVRDIVFDCLRCKRSFAALGGDETGYGLVLGWARHGGIAALFDGQGHAPPAPQAEGRSPDGIEALDCPDWLAPALQDSLGPDFAAVMQALRQRAPVFLRVNLARGGPEAALHALAQDGVHARPHALADTALEVTEGARRIQQGRAYAEGIVELQDASSQAVVAMLPLRDGMRVLDYCAGGGGKTLAMAARARVTLFAHDAMPRRMADLPDRAKRAGARIALTEQPEKSAPYDLVLADVPCSGSGSWRRDPQGKWALTPPRLAELLDVQAQILRRAAALVGPGGWLCYATCSLLRAENAVQVATFRAESPGWALVAERQFTPLEGGDGFYGAVLQRQG